MEQLHDAVHFLLAEAAEDGADGLEHGHVVAGEAVALELVDDVAELDGDALRGGLDLLLPQLLLFKPLVAQVQLVCEMMGMSLKAMVSIVSGTVTRCSGRTAESKYHPPSAYNRL